MAKVAGTAFFSIDGVQYSLRGNLKMSLGNVQRSSVVGEDGYHGIKEEPAAAYIECELTDQPTIDLNVLNSLDNVTVTGELINGKSGILRNASQVNKLELDAPEGKYTIRFEGPKGEWFTS